MANLGTRGAIQAYLFGDVPTKDRFKERAYPAQSDRPSEQTFQNLVDSFATVDELQVVIDDLDDNYYTKTETDALLVPKLTQATADALYADISYEATVDTHTAQIAVLQAFDATIPTNYYNKTQSDANYAPKVSTDNRLTALENDKLNVSVFENYKNTIVNPRLNVEHFTWKPINANDTYLLSFLPNAKINIKNLLFTNVPSWLIIPMNGNMSAGLTIIDSSTYNPTVLDNFNTDINGSLLVDGFLIVIRTLQTVVSGTYNVPSNVTLKLEYLY